MPVEPRRPSDIPTPWMSSKQDFHEEEALWTKLAALGPEEPLPENMLGRKNLLLTRLGSLLRCGEYAERIIPFLKHFPREKCD